MQQRQRVMQLQLSTTVAKAQVDTAHQFHDSGGNAVVVEHTAVVRKVAWGTMCKCCCVQYPDGSTRYSSFVPTCPEERASPTQFSTTSSERSKH
jgi:hypothetical protein